MSSDGLEREARQLLCQWALVSTVAARRVVDAGSNGRPGSARPRGQAEHPAEGWARTLERLLEEDRRGELERFVRALRDEVGRARRRPLVDGHVETAEDLADLVLRAAGFAPGEVAVALRCTPTMVRRARLAAGVEPEYGRRLSINGRGVALGVELVANGYSVRAAATLSGVPRSTLHDRARRPAGRD